MFPIQLAVLRYCRIPVVPPILSAKIKYLVINAAINDNTCCTPLWPENPTAERRLPT